MNDKETKKSCLMSMEDIEEENVQWLWYPYIPYGKITTIQGNPGDGKTNLALKIAACVSSGTTLPGLPALEPQNVIYLSAEDGLRDTIKPRLQECGADFKRLFTINDNGKALSLTDERIISSMNESQAKLLIIDPIQAFIGARTDMNKANEVRDVLRPIGKLAEDYKCAVILIGHLNKAQGINSIYRGIGSMDFTAIARNILLVGRHKDDEDLRVFVHTKASLGPQGSSQAFRLGGEGGLEWVDGYDEVTADDILYASKTQKGHKETKLDKAVEFLRGYFAEHEEVESNLIINMAKDRSICKRTLLEAKTYVPGISSHKRGKVWIWVYEKGGADNDRESA